VAAVHDADVRADLFDLGQQVRAQQHGRALRGHRGDQRAHLARTLRVEAVRRLVQYQQLARLEQGRGDGQALLHAERVTAVPLPCGSGQPHPVERRGDAGVRGPRFGGTVGRVYPAQVVPPRQIRVERRTLDQRTDPRQHPCGPVRHRLAEHPVLARRGPDQPEQHPDRGGLAGAVRAEESVHRATRDRQVDGFHRDLAAEPLRQVLRLDREIGHLPATS
jgi:hypothetical protein